MKAEVALLIMNLVCSDPQMSFRDFYGRFFVPQTGLGFRWGYQGETIAAVQTRQFDAAADYLEYRVARAQACPAKR